MAEHLMETTVRTALWQQFNHTLGCLERFLTGCSLEALPVFKKRSDGVIPREALHP